MAYIISKNIGAQFMNVIEIEGFILILIGALSRKGYTQIKSDFNYTMNKIKTKEGFVDTELDSYKFAIVTDLLE